MMRSALYTQVFGALGKINMTGSSPDVVQMTPLSHLHSFHAKHRVHRKGHNCIETAITFRYTLHLTQDILKVEWYLP